MTATAARRSPLSPDLGLGNEPFPQAALPAPESLRRRRNTQAVAVAALLVTLAYLTWRTLYTVNLGQWWISIPLLLLEVHATVGLVLFTLNLWNIDATPPAHPVAATDLKLAILIPTFNEPEQTLLPTIAAAVSVRLDHETWVLDDGQRPEVEQLAHQLGAHYISRPVHDHAKAGNVNYGLTQLDADLVAIIDADHVASANLLRNTVGYFDDPNVALVQTPQDFYNLESFEHEHSFSEQRLFYRAQLAGRNRWNAAFCCGTGVVFRMDALRQVGGLAVETLTEDIHTTLRLHRRGWRTVLHNEVLAHGLAAGDVVQYLGQRLRWGTGAMQVLRLENPAVVSGLTLMQRVSYLTTLLGWFDAWRSLGYLLVPMGVLWLAAIPIQSPITIFAPFFLATFLLQRYAMRRLSRSTSNQAIATVFEMVRMPANLQATLRLFSFSKPAFRVTEKGRVGAERDRMPVPPLLWGLLAATVVTFGWTVASLLRLTPLHYPVPWIAYGALFWLVVNGALLVTAIARIRARRFAAERRASVRFDVDAPVRLGWAPGRLLDASITGVRMILQPSPETPVSSGLHSLAIGLLGQVYTFRVFARSARPELGSDPGTVVGLEFAPGQAPARAALALALFQTGAEPIFVAEDGPRVISRRRETARKKVA